ncbi:MAG: efflux RND transporter periplasmic adaptor subunit [Pontibacterium sp.]
MRRLILPVILIIAFAFGVNYVLDNPPTAQRSAQRPPVSISVDIQTLVSRDYVVQVDSYGRVAPRTQSILQAQVAGEVVWVSPRFRAGGFFEKGDELIRLDDRDYRAALATAEATVMANRQALLEEQARGEQAKVDWKRLGNQGNIPTLVARKPQLDAAKAAVKSAEAAWAQAKLDLARTRITAPYAGRVRAKNIDIGQRVSTSSELGTLFAIDYLEVRLPIQTRDLGFVDLPETYRYSDENMPKHGADVRFVSELIGREEWQGHLVQTEGVIDEDSRQLYVLAQIEDPYGKEAEGRTPLKIGEYVTAQITGKTLQDVIVIPNRTIYQGSYVYVEENGTVQRREVSIAWQNDHDALISSGLQAGDHLVLTALGQVSSGTLVKVRDSQSNGAAAKPALTGE